MSMPEADLALDDLVHGGGDAVGERPLVHRDPVGLGPHHLDQVVGARQAARVRRQDAVWPRSPSLRRRYSLSARSAVECPSCGTALSTDRRRSQPCRPLKKLPSRLHHNAYVTKDQEATRAFYEDLIGLPLRRDMVGGRRAVRRRAGVLPHVLRPRRRQRAGVLPVRQPGRSGLVRSGADAVAVPPHRPQGDARAAAGDPRPADRSRVEARRHVRARARLLPLALHRGSERAAARVHRRCAPTPTRSPPSAEPTPTTR